MFVCVCVCVLGGYYIYMCICTPAQRVNFGKPQKYKDTSESPFKHHSLYSSLAVCTKEINEALPDFSNSQ